MKPLEAIVGKPADAGNGEFNCLAMSVAWVGLGSNLESPSDQVTTAIDALDRSPGVRMLAMSSLYRTVPIGGPPDQPMFCNACAALATSLGARALLDLMHAIEAEHGRVRDVRWGARTLDLDLLAYDDLRCRDPALQLPHSRAFERAFVLVPLAEIAPALTLGSAGRVADLARVIDAQGVERWDKK